VILYSPKISSRLQYIADFIGREIADTRFRITDNKDEFIRHEGARINYSAEHVTEKEIWIKPHKLLFEQKIREQEIQCNSIDGIKTFFPSPGPLQFDIFAASFYLISRYEEYLPAPQKDRYGRYAHENSLAFRENFLNEPLINQWLEILRKIIKNTFPLFPIAVPQFRFLPTYDIDEAYSYKSKGVYRTCAAVLKAFLKGNWSRITERRNVLKGEMQDPYDSFDWIDDVNERFRLDPVYFFLVASKTGKYDRNILPREASVKALLYRHADKYKIGVHPSWQSGDDPVLIKKEKETIEEAAGITIKSSRQHFIRFNFPQTFRHLCEAGIEEDYSMGYGGINGFRASVASPFYWYDLEKEKATSLLLYPFCFMEATAFYEQKLTSEQALAEMNTYFQKVKAVNGMFSFIWHNTYLGTEKIYKGWREAYEKFLGNVEQMNKE